MKKRFVIPEIKKLAEEAKVFYVGGFVRDFLLKQPSKDIDLEVYGISFNDLEKKLKKIFGSRQVKSVGRSFNVLHVSLAGGYNLDVALPRRDSKIGPGHRGIKAEADLNLSMKEAARRRDFTINAMLMDPVTGEVFDFFGGQKDLRNKILRAVDGQTFSEDPLRVLRAAQFASRFGFKVEANTVGLIKKIVADGGLSELSAERVRDELDKLFMRSLHPSFGADLLKNWGIVQKLFPEFERLSACDQEPAWHPEGDVWEHTKLTVDSAVFLIRKNKFNQVEARVIMLAALLHDIGKPDATREIKGKIRAIGHAEIGEKIARQILLRLRCPNILVDEVCIIVREHRYPPSLLKKIKNKEIDQRRYVGEIADLIRRLGPVSLEVFLTVCEADYRGKKLSGVFWPGNKLKEVIKKHHLNDQPLLLGRDVLSVWQKFKKDKPMDGRLIGKLLKTIEENRRLGKVLTKTEAKKFLVEEIKKIS